MIRNEEPKQSKQDNIAMRIVRANSERQTFKRRIRLLRVKLVSKLRYTEWKCKTYLARTTARAVYDDVNTTYWINPARITLSLDHPARDMLNNSHKPILSPLHERGKVQGGNWDLEAFPFEEMDVWKAFRHRFKAGGRWEDTAFCAAVMKSIRGGIRLWHCSTEDEFKQRLRGIESLFEEISKFGFKAQPEVAEGKPVAFGDEDEIQVHINRYGDYIFGDGRHRLCIAKLLDIDKIPVKVARRHQDWVNFRKDIMSYMRNHGDKLYAPVTHPDLSDLPANHGQDRFEIIIQNLDVNAKRILDIGSHWGYFCHRFEDFGADCVAVEANPVSVSFAKRLRRAENKRFKIIAGSALDLKADLEYNVILALNIFHHFIKTEDQHQKLVQFLNRINTKAMVFEPHLSDETQMAGSFRNYAPDEFVSFVKAASGFRRSVKLGTALDGRPLYLLR